jgi:hypothetical protein
MYSSQKNIIFKLQKLTIGSFLWYFWLTRCKLKYDNYNESSFQYILACTIQNINNFLLVNHITNLKQNLNIKHARGCTTLQRNKQHNIQLTMLKWIKPNNHFMKLNSDATYSYNTKASFGGILRDHTGKLLFSYYGPIAAHSPLEAEFISVLIGCRICNILKMKFANIILEIDNYSLIEAIKSGNCPLYKHVNRWLELFNYTQHIHIAKHTFRESNAVADLLAKQGKLASKFSIQFSIYALTSLCRNYILLDQWEVPYIKMSINQ